MFHHRFAPSSFGVWGFVPHVESTHLSFVYLVLVPPVRVLSRTFLFLWDANSLALNTSAPIFFFYGDGPPKNWRYTASGILRMFDFDAARWVFVNTACADPSHCTRCEDVPYVCAAGLCGGGCKCGACNCSFLGAVRGSVARSPFCGGRVVVVVVSPGLYGRRITVSLSLLLPATGLNLPGRWL